MIRLALIGKGISHSKSPEVYRELLKKDHRYDLIDVEREQDLPSINDLKKTYLGVNITTPYKRSYLDRVKVSKLGRSLGPINCLRLNGDTPMGECTDYQGIADTFFKIKEQHKSKRFVILGDGAMSMITQKFLFKHGLKFEVLSRKRTGDISKIDFSSYQKALIINTCSRKF